MDLTVLLTYGFLAVSIIALWFNKKLFGKISLWIIFLSIAFIFALSFSFANFVSLLYTLAFGLCVYYYYKTGNIVYFLFSVVLSFPLFAHMPFAGFKNYQFLDAISISKNSLSYSLYFNFDKTLIALFIIGFGSSHQKINVGPIFRRVMLYLPVMVVLLLLLALLMGYTRFEPKIPDFTPVWVLTNLLFVCTAEEALFRKLIQGKIESTLKFKNSHILSILLASLLYGLVHFRGGIAYIALATIAGLFYGHIYYKTKRVESSILLHFSFNLVHFIFFTYPALNI